MSAAPLPGRAGQGGADGGQQPRVGIGGDQPDPGQASGGQRPQEGQPAGPVLGRRHVDAQDLPVTLGVDPHRFVIRATQRAWGWRAVQSELGDDIS
ncbi:MAG: hypothetical protein QOH82_1553 [Mycobacterium sp.]|nr:hypothetical protein [Mycobacterium sp.]